MRIAILGCLLLCWCGCGRDVARNANPVSDNGDVAWEVVSDRGTVRVTKPARRNERFDADTANWSPEDPAWQRYLVVVCGADPEAVPPLIGSYQRDGDDLVFTSRFPLASNVIYWAYFDPSGT